MSSKNSVTLPSSAGAGGAARAGGEGPSPPGAAAELVGWGKPPPLYTAGTSARDADLVEPGLFPVFRTGRGGQFTYHGPGQRVGYVMLDLKARGSDVRAYVRDLEEWLIRALARFNVKGERRAGRVGAAPPATNHQLPASDQPSAAVRRRDHRRGLDRIRRRIRRPRRHRDQRARHREPHLLRGPGVSAEPANAGPPDRPVRPGRPSRDQGHQGCQDPATCPLGGLRQGRRRWLRARRW